MKIKYLAAASALAAVAGTAGYAAPVSGFNDVIDNGGGSYTFIFDTLTGSDIDGNSEGLLFDNGAGLTLTATGTGPAAAGGTEARTVRQDLPADGGLGILGTPNGDNLGAGEFLKLTFNQVVDILGFTLNDGHTDAASGSFSLAATGNSGVGPAASWDGVGLDALSQGTLCLVASGWCNTTFMEFGSAGPDGWTGYVESVTIRVSVIPLPAAGWLMIAGLGGLAAMRRRKS